jgi:hypothetical protein
MKVVEACKVSGCSRIIGIARDEGKLARGIGITAIFIYETNFNLK